MRIGEIIREQYLVERLLGKGGMGNVYLVSELNKPKKTWALKETCWDDSDDELATELFRQFQIEASLLKNLKHPMLPKIKEYFSISPSHFLVMEYLPGKNLEELSGAQLFPLPVNRVAAWGVNICELLKYLHRRIPPVIVSDLTPANLILTGKERLKLLDLGIARLMGEKTSPLIPPGTPGYIAPEILKGKPPSPLSDLFSLGVLLYVLSTKKSPHQLANDREINSPLREIILDLTQEDPAERCQTPQECALKLSPIASLTPDPVAGKPGD